jgi:hypothetical protein
MRAQVRLNHKVKDIHEAHLDSATLYGGIIGPEKSRSVAAMDVFSFHLPIPPHTKGKVRRPDFTSYSKRLLYKRKRVSLDTYADDVYKYT